MSLKAFLENQYMSCQRKLAPRENTEKYLIPAFADMTILFFYNFLEMFLINP